MSGCLSLWLVHGVSCLMSARTGSSKTNHAILMYSIIKTVFVNIIYSQCSLKRNKNWADRCAFCETKKFLMLLFWRQDKFRSYSEVISTNLTIFLLLCPPSNWSKAEVCNQRVKWSRRMKQTEMKWSELQHPAGCLRGAGHQQQRNIYTVLQVHWFSQEMTAVQEGWASSTSFVCSLQVQSSTSPINANQRIKWMNEAA